MVSVEDFQSIDFNEDYIIYCLKELKVIQGHVNSMKKIIQKLEEEIKISDEKINCVCNEVNSFIFWMKNIKKVGEEEVEKKKHHLDNYQKLYDKYMNFNKSISLLIQKDFVRIMNDLNQKLNVSVTNFKNIKFFPPKSGNFDNANVKLNVSDMKTNDYNTSSTDYYNSTKANLF